MSYEYDPMDIDSPKPKQKKVSFSENITYHETYSRKQYDRSCIYSAMYLRCRRKISDFEWRKIFVDLNRYKLQEMDVHPLTKNNISVTKIKNM